jgi:hypothetical protein
MSFFSKSGFGECVHFGEYHPRALGYNGNNSPDLLNLLNSPNHKKVINYYINILWRPNLH